MYWHFPIFEITLKKVKSTQVHHLNNIGSTRKPNASTKFQGHQLKQNFRIIFKQLSGNINAQAII